MKREHQITWIFALTGVRVFNSPILQTHENDWNDFHLWIQDWYHARERNLIDNSILLFHVRNEFTMMEDFIMLGQRCIGFYNSPWIALTIKKAIEFNLDGLATRIDSSHLKALDTCTGWKMVVVWDGRWCWKWINFNSPGVKWIIIITSV